MTEYRNQEMEAHYEQINLLKRDKVLQWRIRQEIQAENARLREALEPFAGMAQHCEGMSDSESQCVFVGDLRAARAAIREEKTNGE